MKPFGWVSIIRLGLAQSALGAIIVLSTSTLNRVMIVELALPAVLPGFLVGLYSALQLSRPMWGHVADSGGRRTPWIIRGMAVLAAGGATAAHATAVMQQDVMLGIAYGVLAYTLIGFGVGAGGTSLLTLLATRVAPERRAPAASLVWLMMILGFIVTTAVVGQLLEPFSFQRLVEVCGIVSLAAFVVSVLAVLGIEAGDGAPSEEPERRSFGQAFRSVWSDDQARAFTIFVFAAMLGYSTQDLILEPYAGAVFGFSAGASTHLTTVQQSGVLIGMIMVAVAASGEGQSRFLSLKQWTLLGCLGSGLVLVGIAFAGLAGVPAAVLRALVGVLGFVNGTFAVGAIGWMMALAGKRRSQEGIRMGLWGGAQAIALAVGAFLGPLGVDLFGLVTTSVAIPYVVVFIIEAAIFSFAARLAARMVYEGRAQGASELMAVAFSPEDAPPSFNPSPRPLVEFEGAHHEPIYRRHL